MARKQISTDKVKRLPPGTDVFCVKEGRVVQFWIVKVGRTKMLRSPTGANLEIKDRPGWHYEIEVKT